MAHPHMHKGWVGVRLDVKNVDWEELAGILEDGYLLSAPKRLAKLRSGAAAASARATEKGRAKRPRARRP